MTAALKAWSLRLLVGRALANREQGQQQIGPFEGVPAMGLDGLASSAYGPEAALAVLAPAGAAAFAAIGPVMAVILALLAVLYVSYRQTIRAYPSSGGAYTVVKENLGTNPSLLAAAALMIDYVLNVAVGISAGVGQAVSAIPVLQPYTLWLCLAILAVLTILNLRGTMEAGRVFAVPTYAFVGSFAVVLVLGLFQTLAAHGHPQPVMAPPAPRAATEMLGLWLLLRSFASGCTAMTGVEAVSNAVSAFRAPVVRQAHLTLSLVVGILGLLLGGIAYLASAYSIGAMDQAKAGYQSVLSQLAGAAAGRGVLYDVVMASVLCVLALSANTSFTGFPRLCRLVAMDEFLPRPFAIVGRRLVNTAGILYLAATAGVLLVAFNGITDRLIPLFAIGAFLTFTLSQAGMVAHWRRDRHTPEPRPRQLPVGVSLATNATGATATGVALVIIILAKFVDGAWITVLIIPCVIVLLKSIKRYYGKLDQQLREGPIDLRATQAPIALIATPDWNRLTDRALAFAMRISPEVIAVHLIHLSGPEMDEHERTLRQRWREDVERPARAAGLKPPALKLLQAPYRNLHVPLLAFIQALEKRHKDREIAVLIPEIVKRAWWEHFLHTRRAQRLRTALLRFGGPRLTVISVPWHLDEGHLDEPASADALAQEEDVPPHPPRRQGAGRR